MFKRTIVSGLIATTVAAATLAGTVQPSAAHGHHHRELGIGIAAGVGGFVLGSLLAQQPRTVYVEDDGYDSIHVRRCYARYASYDERTDTYMSYDGPRYCRL
ncbi:hypothetical protein LCM4577_10365 [Mesorhizobium sp. LCM 4577]|uniref:Lectin-like protein BA14k n=1 Tax=Mesorhizobium plurifarium TaxID=69974 RepID=A0A090FRA0_MESPL|nr:MULTISPECIES: BA14K family protein [unclassified Mesorhizobium]OHV60814.1 hypothetical protein LCM4576_33055 [Mesorhizobium sp. LCM 4576]OHV64092.1 hypothetical protein LCM4577_10365 [Mesorhizobium sp. LCM 4577]OHV74769.1 hypothetical protein LCM4576_12760 [Mesorhizobium sp. LCM 4576]CDX21437.1 conserved exported hypothetical protein [Mesorhizobium plurifarium]